MFHCRLFYFHLLFITFNYFHQFSFEVKLKLYWNTQVLHTILLLKFYYTYFYILNYVSKDYLLTIHTCNDICETESRPSYHSPLCISGIKSEYIYQVRWHLLNNWLLSSQMTFLKTKGTSIVCIFRKQNMFIKLKLLPSSSMNQFI